MGFFIVGILVGWLAEWVFFTFFVKGNNRSNDNSNTSALQKELSLKNNEIKALQAKLADSGKTSSSSEVKSTPKAEVKASTVSKPATASTKAAVAKKPEAASKNKKKTVAKPQAKKPAAKAPAKTASKVAPKKAPVKKPPAKPAAKKPAAKKAKAASTGDDFTRLSGIGPSMAATLNELGIDTYKKLANMDDDILRDMLEASGARLNNNKEAMDTWNEQATLADKGDFEGLKKMQEALKK